jgi:hypothetical protein
MVLVGLVQPTRRALGKFIRSGGPPAREGSAMVKAVGWLVIVLVLYTVVAHPDRAAGMTNRGLVHLESAGDSMVSFCDHILR